LIDQIDGQAESIELGKAAKKHMQEAYTWEKIAREYEELFLR